MRVAKSLTSDANKRRTTGQNSGGYGALTIKETWKKGGKEKNSPGTCWDLESKSTSNWWLPKAANRTPWSNDSFTNVLAAAILACDYSHSRKLFDNLYYRRKKRADEWKQNEVRKKSYLAHLQFPHNKFASTFEWQLLFQQILRRFSSWFSSSAMITYIWNVERSSYPSSIRRSRPSNQGQNQPPKWPLPKCKKVIHNYSSFGRERPLLFLSTILWSTVICYLFKNIKIVWNVFNTTVKENGWQYVPYSHLYGQSSWLYGTWCCTMQWWFTFPKYPNSYCLSLFHFIPILLSIV